MTFAKRGSLCIIGRKLMTSRLECLLRAIHEAGIACEFHGREKGLELSAREVADLAEYLRDVEAVLKGLREFDRKYYSPD